MTLHDWIDELCDALDIEAEVDEGLILDLARDVAHGVEKLAARAQLLAEGWDRPPDAKDPVDIDDDVPDDSLVDHTGDRFED